MKDQRFYRRREKKVMKDLGLQPQPLSGAGWMAKEDGQNEIYLAQLKSTQAASYSIKVADIQELVKNSLMTGKIPVFVIDFLEYDLKLLCFRESDIIKLSQGENNQDLLSE